MPIGSSFIGSNIKAPTVALHTADGVGGLPSFWSGTLLYIPSDDSIADESAFGRTLTAGANCTLNTTTKKYGAGSMFGDGTTGDPSLTWALDSAFNATGEFCFAGWCKPGALAGESLLSFGTFRTALQGFAVTTGGANNYEMWYNNALDQRVGTVTTDWHHIVINRDGSDVMRFILDGTTLWSKSIVGTLAWSTYPFELFDNPDSGLPNEMTGYWDDVIWVANDKVFESSFTPPTGPHNDPSSY